MSRIMMVASEAAPFIKTGGLADVMGSLPAALERLREEVAVVLPRYRTAKMPHTERVWHQMHIHCGPHYFQVGIDRYEERGVVYLFVDCPPLFDRGGIYGEWGGSYHDNHLRYAVLSLAALGIARHGIFRPDVFHTHDWHTGLLPAYLRANYGGDPELRGCKLAFTIHNLGYQGNYSRDVMGELGLDGWLYHSDGLEFWNQVSFMKSGDHVVRHRQRGQSDLCTGDSDPRVWFQHGWRAAQERL